MAIYQESDVTVTGQGEPQRLRALMATPARRAANVDPMESLRVD